MKRVAFITGANDGIGKATAKKLAQNGYHVVIFARREDACIKVVNEINEICGEDTAAYYAGDVTIPDDLKKGVELAVSKYGGLNVLVCCAAAQGAGTVLDVEPEDYEKMFKTNVMGYGMAAKMAIPELLKAESPAIVNIASLNGNIGVAGRTLYNCTKAAVIEMTQSMACDFPAIRINCVSPGFTASESMIWGLQHSGFDADTCAKLISAGTLMKRMADPSEIAAAVAFLASEEASFITGHNLVADGGALCYGHYDYEMEKFLEKGKREY